MEFRDNKAIYLQIAEYVSENIMLGRWPGDEKIPSVRDLAIDLQVNPNTVARAYELLQNQGIISNKRGIGFWVVSDASDKIKSQLKDRFLSQELPEFFKKISLLNISLDEISKRFTDFNTKKQ